VKKDDDYIRALLFDYEAEDEWLLEMPGDTLDANPEERRERYHVLLMMDEGLITKVGNGTIRLTSRGHAYLDAIRDDNIWKKTKAGVAKAGGASLALMFDLATGYARQKVSEITGIPL
jgi:Hypothetical protein (DUF2513)